MVVSGLSGLFSLLAAGLNLFGAGIGAMGGGSEGQVPAFLTGTLGALINLVSFSLYLFMFYGAYNMKALKSWTLAMAASILALLPCSLCCIIGLPIGIWAIVVLNKPEVKMAFESKRGHSA